MFTRPLLTLAVFALLSCAERRATPPAAVPPVAAITPPLAERRPDAPLRDGVASPLQASWVTVLRDDHHAVLRARVERSARLNLPLTLTVTVPNGVRIERGAASTLLPPATQEPTLELEYELSFAHTPDEDVTLSVDGDTDAMGLHARAPYRFGRPEPEGPRPVASGPAIVLGGLNLGRAVPASP